jgi:hypothetical protein
MVECRYFGGLDVAEAAALLEVSEATIHRDWRAARAWLEEEIVRTRGRWGRSCTWTAGVGNGCNRSFTRRPICRPARGPRS